MWLWVTNMLSNPGRSLRQLLVTIAVLAVLLVALAFAGPATLGSLATLLGLSGLLLMFRVPVRIILPLMLATILIAGAASLVSEVLALGMLPLIGAGAVVAGTFTVWMRTFRAAPRSRGARWATVRDLRRAGFLGEHGWTLGIVDGRPVRLPMDREREGLLVTAATGSGKSSRLAIPAILAEAARPDLRSLLIVDPKDELARLTMATLARTHRVLLWDPSDPDACTVGFDPLATLPDPSDEGFVGEVKQLAQSWFEATRGGNETSDRFWVNQPRALMEALFLGFVMTHPKGTFVELADWTRRLKIEGFQDILDHTPHPAVRASAEMLHSLGMSERTIGPIWSDVLQRFDVLDDPRVRRSMTGSPVDQSFVTHPTAFYLRLGAQEAQRLAPLLSMALGQMYRAMTKLAAQSPGNRLEREVRVIVDEFGNLPRILGIENALATLRSYGVGHYMFVQTTAQLTHLYGRELAETVQDNLMTRIVLGGAAYGDAKTFSERCGEITEFHANRSWSGQGILGRRSHHLSHAPERRPLISPAEIIHMRDEVLVSTRGMPPIRAVAQPYFLQRRST